MTPMSTYVCLTSFFTLTVLPALSYVITAPCAQSPIDVTGDYGVKTEKIPGSRVQYHPLPDGFQLTPGQTVSLEFATISPTGLIFAAGNFEHGDVVAAFMHKGYLTFARQCGSGRVFEVFRQKLDDGKWHSVIYMHTLRGGEMFVDGQSHFRQYHMGPCVDFHSLFLGGFPPEMDLARWTVREDGSRQFLHGIKHRFEGCIRHLRINKERPSIQPKYYAVSECDNL